MNGVILQMACIRVFVAMYLLILLMIGLGKLEQVPHREIDILLTVDRSLLCRHVIAITNEQECMGKLCNVSLLIEAQQNP